MCFSATASFTAAALLTAVGCVNLKLLSERKQYFLSAIPFLFAFQQFVEGFLWLSAGDPSQFINYSHIGKYLFLTVAILIWPIWIPLSLFAVEKISLRKKLLGAVLLIGLVYNVLIISNYFKGANDASVAIIGHSIQYQLPDAHNFYFYAAYLAAVLIPPFISSLNLVWVLGILNFVGLLVAQYFYEVTFISVWCFFAAVISISLYYIFRANFGEVKSITERINTK